MTTEEDFQAMLDANPHDHVTRAVFADWLEERGDERAAGYRALAQFRRFPAYSNHAGNGSSLPFDWFEGWSFYGGGCEWYKRTTPNELPDSWRWKLPCNSRKATGDQGMIGGSWQRTRREAEDAAALAWLELTDAERADVLAKGQVAR